MVTWPAVAIVIVNWNGREHLETCLPAVFEQTYCSYQVVCVDNGSHDGSVEWMQARFPQIHLVALNRNTGFAEGTNIGIRAAFKNPAIRFVATLNNDTRVDARWLAELVDAANMHSSIGSCASKMLCFDDLRRINSTGILPLRDGRGKDRGFDEPDCGQYDRPEEVFGACAGAALYRREALECVGFFDEDYFAYFEDLELAWRLRLAGYRCSYVPTAVVFHKGAGTAGAHSLLKIYNGERNRMWTVLIHFPPAHIVHAFLYSIAWYGLTAWRGVCHAGKAGPFVSRHGWAAAVLAVVRAQCAAWMTLPAILKKRRRCRRRRTTAGQAVHTWLRKYSISLNEDVNAEP